ncbi:hypothetical protein KBD20_02100 [Candidatus Saccharibacteria bacterium]|nr:hypothetical protein [Candidatus Saccharibacteria bacterium]
MTTIVFQSYRTHSVPVWIETCLNSVQNWAYLCGYDYRFYDDTFFNEVPDWFRARAQNEICPITDLARLIVAKKLLTSGYQRVIWVDADMLIFNPKVLDIEVNAPFAFCQEDWMTVYRGGQVQISQRVNNSICFFTKEDDILTELINDAISTGKSNDLIEKLDIGTKYLTDRHKVTALPLINSVAILDPPMVKDILRDDRMLIRRYTKYINRPIGAVNLCASLVCDDNMHRIYTEATLTLLSDYAKIFKQ